MYDKLDRVVIAALAAFVVGYLYLLLFLATDVSAETLLIFGSATTALCAWVGHWEEYRSYSIALGLFLAALIVGLFWQ